MKLKRLLKYRKMEENLPLSISRNMNGKYRNNGHKLIIRTTFIFIYFMIMYFETESTVSAHSYTR